MMKFLNPLSSHGNNSISSESKASPAKSRTSLLSFSNVLSKGKTMDDSTYTTNDGDSDPSNQSEEIAGERAESGSVEDPVHNQKHPEEEKQDNRQEKEPRKRRTGSRTRGERRPHSSGKALSPKVGSSSRRRAHEIRELSPKRTSSSRSMLPTRAISLEEDLDLGTDHSSSKNLEDSRRNVATSRSNGERRAGRQAAKGLTRCTSETVLNRSTSSTKRTWSSGNLKRSPRSQSSNHLQQDTAKPMKRMPRAHQSSENLQSVSTPKTHGMKKTLRNSSHHNLDQRSGKIHVRTGSSSRLSPKKTGSSSRLSPVRAGSSRRKLLGDRCVIEADLEDSTSTTRSNFRHLVHQEGRSEMKRSAMSSGNLHGETRGGHQMKRSTMSSCNLVSDSRHEQRERIRIRNATRRALSHPESGALELAAPKARTRRTHSNLEGDSLDPSAVVRSRGVRTRKQGSALLSQQLKQAVEHGSNFCMGTKVEEDKDAVGMTLEGSEKRAQQRRATILEDMQEEANEREEDKRVEPLASAAVEGIPKTKMQEKMDLLGRVNLTSLDANAVRKLLAKNQQRKSMAPTANSVVLPNVVGSGSKVERTNTTGAKKFGLGLQSSRLSQVRASPQDLIRTINNNTDKNSDLN